MNSREKGRSIFEKSNTGRPAFWTGHLNRETLPLLLQAWQLEGGAEAVLDYLNDDCRWIAADSGYKHPEGKPALDPGYGINRAISLGASGCFAEAETIAEIEAYPWPDPAYADFSEVYAEIDKHQDKLVFTGMWCPFFHKLCDFFGMEEYFVKMYEAPEVVEAATEKVVDYYVAMNDRFFAGLGDRADVMFFGNDFGTQRDLLISPEKFRQFVLPSFKRLIAVGKKYGKKILLHSCGSIARIIPDLIDAGIDGLHPLQAQAQGMAADQLAQYKEDIAFVGGIDAQTFIVNATPADVQREVRRVHGLLGPNMVVSLSHEEVLPNIPPDNLLAIARTAASLQHRK